MNKHIRILILDQDRYSALIIEREMARSLPNIIPVVFHDAEAALHELEQCRYDVAILDYDTCGDRNGSEPPSEVQNAALQGVSYLDDVRRCRQKLPMVVLMSDAKNGYDDVRRTLRIAGAGIIESLTKSGGFHKALPDLVRGVLKGGNPESVGPGPHWEHLADAGTEALRTVSGRLAHEVNNPLMTIMGMTELLLSGNGEYDEQVLKKVRIIRKSAQRIAVALERMSAEATLEKKTRAFAGPSGISIAESRADFAGLNCEKA